jgi:hypothetical protein
MRMKEKKKEEKGRRSGGCKAVTFSTKESERVRECD